ncbi:hypothetical protein SKAU_G00378680 [Synaphobranchus kaupii]|uniref:RNA-binding protein 14 n=1 Tax=Synaphobranchus kaupii TaxID=118154 RepID=A0A9Q1ED83_SYNKA|nr:hypothetical protein SKAU_G00378680 [Synaphobranchus kaupii]
MESGSTTKLEFGVQMTCNGCVNAVRTALERAQGVQSVEIDLAQEQVLVESTLTSQEVQVLIENTGRRAVLMGVGAADQDLGAAVAMMGGAGPVQGVVRFVQVTEDRCLIDGTIDGLEAGPHGLHVHELGDLTRDCLSCGDHFNPYGKQHGAPRDSERHAGDLGNIVAEANGRASFRLEDSQLKVWDIIGRSLVVDSGEDDLGRGGHPLSKQSGNSGERLACGIIARSASLFQNAKKICACDGVTIWEERDRPLAGKGRKATDTPAANLTNVIELLRVNRARKGCHHRAFPDFPPARGFRLSKNGSGRYHFETLHRLGAMDKSNTVKLFVGNLALDTTQEELTGIFEPYGTVVSCSVLRQFAFVHLQGEGAAARAIQELNGREFRGRNLVVEESRGRPLHSTKVFVGNLSGMCTTEDLQELFQTFGKVLECDKVKARLSSSAGYAFVHMESKEDALQAIEALHGTSFKGRPLSVELSKVQPNKQAPTGKIPCVSCGKQGHYAGECPVGKPTLEQYQSQAAVLAAAAAAAAGLPLQVQQSVHNSVYNTSTFDPTYAALTGLTTGSRTDGTPVSPAVYGALASQVYGTVASQLYGSAANQALTSGAAQVYSSMSGSANPVAVAAAAYAGHQVYAAPGVSPMYLAAPGDMGSVAVDSGYGVTPALYGAAAASADPTGQAIFEAARAHYFAQGQQVLAEQQAGSKSGDRDRSPVRRSAPLLPDPVPKPFLYQRPKRRALLPTPTARLEETAAAEEDPMARYYAEYYQQCQQYQQYQQYPQYQFAYPPPTPVIAMPAQPAATLEALQAAAAAAAAAATPAALASPRVYDPPPPPRKEPLLRHPDIPHLHTPEPPYR